MADHKIRHIRRLVERSAHQSCDGQPEGRSDNAIREILGQALDRRTGDTRLAQPVGIAADDHRCGRAAGFQPPLSSAFTTART